MMLSPIGAAGFEPAASWSQSRTDARTTKHNTHDSRTNRAQDARAGTPQRARCAGELVQSWYLLLLLLGALVTPLYGQRQPLATADHLLWGASTALLVVDWGQTSDGMRRGNNEYNPLLGAHPSRAEVNLYWVGVLAANTLVSRIHKREVRRVVWSFVAGLEVGAVSRNRRVGLRWRIPF